MELHNLLKDKSILNTRVSLLDWFSKSVKTCPAVVGKTVRWNIHCYACDKIMRKEVEDWGSMEPREYEYIVCNDCYFNIIHELAKQYNSIEQYEI